SSRCGSTAGWRRCAASLEQVLDDESRITLRASMKKSARKAGKTPAKKSKRKAAKGSAKKSPKKVAARSARRSPTKANDLVYVYGIVRDTFDATGAPGGLDDTPVAVAKSGRIGALMSRVPDAGFEPKLI